VPPGRDFRRMLAACQSTCKDSLPLADAALAATSLRSPGGSVIVGGGGLRAAIAFNFTRNQGDKEGDQWLVKHLEATTLSPHNALSIHSFHQSIKFAALTARMLRAVIVVGLSNRQLFCHVHYTLFSKQQLQCPLMPKCSLHPKHRTQSKQQTQRNGTERPKRKDGSGV